ncbi:hypothetical protein L7F22_062481 [Adiantum nelumboides]|nr:hypothetical protein [Adiantum nelumboides]
MPAPLSFSVSSLRLPCQSSLPLLFTRLADSTRAEISSSAASFKVLPIHYSFKSSSPPIPLQTGALNHSLCALLALGLSTIEILFPLQPALAEAYDIRADEAPLSGGQCMPSSPTTYLRYLNPQSAQESPNVAEKGWEDVDAAVTPSIETHPRAEDHILCSMPTANLFEISFAQAEQSNRFLDYARVFSPAEAASLLNHIDILEAEAGWRLRVITKSGTGSPIAGKDLKELWKPDDRTIIVIEDISSPNILNFNAGSNVMSKLPRQFFLELQSRYGNQFFVQQEGEGEALTRTVQAIRECLQRSEGCKNVPGLTNDLYYLTLATSIVGGCVFGFAARLPPSGRVEASWQWVLFLSPLWLLLFVSFGVLPVVGRTPEVEPLLKNAVGFAVGAFALYLTPIFGPSPISKK